MNNVTEQLRIAEDREREGYVHAMMQQISAEAGDREFTRAAINSAWINGRKQILARRAAPAEAAQGEVERLRAENEFLHKRRGELVIERDYYKAALGEYPEGRDVILAALLVEIERLRALAPKAAQDNDAPTGSHR